MRGLGGHCEWMRVMGDERRAQGPDPKGPQTPSWESGASPEGSGEPWKECEYEQLWDHIQDGPEGRDDAWGEQGLGLGGLEKGG